MWGIRVKVSFGEKGGTCVCVAVIFCDSSIAVLVWGVNKLAFAILFLYMIKSGKLTGSVGR